MARGAISYENCGPWPNIKEFDWLLRTSICWNLCNWNSYRMYHFDNLLVQTVFLVELYLYIYQVPPATR